MAKIRACKLWNSTGVVLTAGRRYRFSATGTWKDWKTGCPATGYQSERLRPFESLRRCTDAKWFSLIGAVEKEKSTCFDIGRLMESGEIYTATSSGMLYCFANDVVVMYWNNSGAVELEVECLD